MTPTERKILEILKELPEEKIQETLDFVEFIARRQTKTGKSRKEIVEMLYGYTKGSPLTSEWFAQWKAEEIAMEDR